MINFLKRLWKLFPFEFCKHKETTFVYDYAYYERTGDSRLTEKCSKCGKVR